MSIFGSIFSAILGGISSSSQAKTNSADIKLTGEQQIKNTVAGGEQDRLTLLAQAVENRETTAFAAALEDYYKQRDRGEKRDALGLYSGFSTMEQFAPGYDASKFTPIQAGPLPNPASYDNPANYASLEAAALANKSKYTR